MKNSVKAIVVGVFIYVAVVTALMYLVKNMVDMPVVYVSWTTRECVKVEPKGSCNDLPERYNRIWVR